MTYLGVCLVATSRQTDLFEGDSIMRAEVAKMTLLASMVVTFSYAPSVQSAMYKCTTPEGKVAYQDSPCPLGSTEKSLKVAPSPPVSTQKQPPIYVAPVPHSMYQSAASSNVPKNIDLKGPLETWDRFGKAFNRGDKSAAMRELTPSAQQQYGPILDQLMPPSGGGSARR